MNLIRTLNRNITPSRIDSRYSELACYGGCLGILIFGILKLSSLKLSETEMFLGLLLVLAVAMLEVIIGLLIGLRTKPFD